MDNTDAVSTEDAVAVKLLQVYWYGSTGVDLRMLEGRFQAELPPGTQVFGCRECACRDRGVCYYWLYVRLLEDAVASEIEDTIYKVVESLDGGTVFAEALERERATPPNSQACRRVALDDEEGRFVVDYCTKEKNSVDFLKSTVATIVDWKEGIHSCGESFAWWGKLEFPETLYVCLQAQDGGTSPSMTSRWL